MLLNENNWEQVGTATIEECIQALQEMWNEHFKVCSMIGEIIHGAWDTVPDNLILCDGSQYLRVDYPQLYDIINPLFHVDADNFFVPDLENLFVKGSSGAEPDYSVGGSHNRTLSVNNLPSHNHSTSTGVSILVEETVGVPVPVQSTIPQPASTGSTGNGQSFDNQPSYKTLSYYIVGK